jgi:DNA-binding MarR family transcriptional regulator
VNNTSVRDLDAQVEALQTATRDLVGVTLRSLDLLEGHVSLPQFRMLAALDELGRCPSSAVARELGLGASSVTRLGDRLEASGHIVRGNDPRSRSVVTVELSPAGRALVTRVMRWQREELARILGRLPARRRTELAGGLCELHAAAGGQYATETYGPLPL